MAHIQVELDAIKSAQLAAPLLGIPAAQSVGGLSLLWAHCWNRLRDDVSSIEVEGCFGGDNGRLCETLVAFGFLEVLEQGRYRVRGAERYLRISEAQSAAGKARAGDAKRAGGRFKKTSSPPAPHQLPTSSPPAPRQPSPALTPITDHRSPITEEARSKDSSTSVDPPAPTDQLVELWNATAAPEMPRCNRLTDERRKKAKKLLGVVPLDEWPKLIANANASDFCRGIGNDWKLSLAWMLERPENALKVLEGNYANGGTKRARDAPDPRISREGFARYEPPPAPLKTPAELIEEGKKAWLSNS
jgi:hypothetical protein